MRFSIGRLVFSFSIAPTEKEKKIADLKRLREIAGERRDGEAIDDIEAELFRLTGDQQYAPYATDEDEDEP